MTKQKFGLTGTALKTIALVLMVMDHIHYFFEFTGVVPEWFSMLARLSAPLFLFCTVEALPTPMTAGATSCVSGLGTAMGTVEFFMIYAGAFRRGDGFYPLNAIFQDLMLLCIIWQGIDWLRQRRFVRGALAAVMPILWPICIAALLMLFPKFRTRRSAPPCWRGLSRHRFPCGRASPTAAGLFWPAASRCMRCITTSAAAGRLGGVHVFDRFCDGLSAGSQLAGFCLFPDVHSLL